MGGWGGGALKMIVGLHSDKGKKSKVVREKGQDKEEKE